MKFIGPHPHTGIYTVLFYQAVYILLSRRTQHYKYHLACLSILFGLSTLHVALAWGWAFLTDHGDMAIYELFSLKNPLPTLYFPDDPRSVRGIGVALKARYSLANAIADGILIYRCYIIWGFNWRPVVFPLFAYACTLAGGIMTLLPLSGTTERTSITLCIVTIFFTNVLSAGLAAGRIWWISRRAASYMGRRSQKKYMALTAILLESGLIYPAALLITIAVFITPSTPTNSVLVCIAACYHIVGIAPTLIIVRVGLGVSTDDVDKCVTISRGTTGMQYEHDSHEQQHGLGRGRRLAVGAGTEATLELQVRVTTEEATVGSFSDAKGQPV
ncbi:hypothetical protein C8F04DRAFT_1092029 [Mycena alexandri]|uniref:Uncharacterized protein n=1 Tax=Mycena alexandri TaxID=1745969 RepID=A0AAD6T3C7_9AGAR|nr:hypothetical protein C8F04DRAFT_1092029 [Mycena alexandri]